MPWWSSWGSTMGLPGLKPIVTQFYHRMALNTSPCKEVCTVEGFLLLLSPCPGKMAKCSPSSKSNPKCHHLLQGALLSLSGQKSLLLMPLVISHFPAPLWLVINLTYFLYQIIHSCGQKPCFISTPELSKVPGFFVKRLINICGKGKSEEWREDALVYRLELVFFFTFINKG